MPSEHGVKPDHWFVFRGKCIFRGTVFRIGIVDLGFVDPHPAGPFSGIRFRYRPGPFVSQRRGMVTP